MTVNDVNKLIESRRQQIKMAQQMQNISPNSLT